MPAHRQGDANLFRLLVESAKDYAIYALDPNGVVTSWNEGAARINGYTAAEIIGKHFSIFYPREDVEAGKCELELARAAADGRFEDEGIRLRKDGTPIWANVVITALRDETGALIGFAKVTRDLTDRRAREDERVRQAMSGVLRLQELGGELAEAPTPEAIIELLVRRGASALGAEAASFTRLEGDEVVLVVAVGVDQETRQKFTRIPVAKRMPSTAPWQTKWSLFVETPQEFRREFPDTVAIDAGASCSMPLSVGDRILGGVAFRFPSARAFSAFERAFIEAFVQQAAQALDRAETAVREVATRRRLEEARASLATTLRSIGDAVIATDAHGNVTMMNPVAESLTGWMEADARGRPLSEVFVILNEHTRAPVVSPVDKVLELGTIVGLANHTVLIKKDGVSEVAIDDSGAPIRGNDGKIEGVVLVFRDVTTKKQEETERALLEQAGAALAESLDYEATLQKVAQLAVPKLADWVGVDLLRDHDTSAWRQVAVAHVDPAKVEWAREYGRKYPPDPKSPHGVPNVLRTGKPEIYPVVTEEMLRAGARSEDELAMTIELNPRSVIIVPLLAHGRILGALSLVRSDSDTPYEERDLELAQELARRCASAIDNARLYDAEQQARSAADFANRAKDEFLATVSHELRTPLNAIMGWAKMLSSGSLANDSAKTQKAISTIDRNAVAMAQLIEDLLDISRIISGKMRLEVQTVQLGRVIEAAVDAVRPAADAKEIVIGERLDENAQTTNGDPARLQQVVWNLLSNAVKFTPRQGRIDIEVVPDESGVSILVTDTGKGIDPRFLPHVFDPFRQEDASHTRTRGGLGLGLAITKQLVELHGGSVSALSAGEGKGSTFRVHLPTSELPSPPQTRTSRTRKFRLDSVFEQLPKLHGVHALVVDDEEDARALLKTVLEEFGARVTLAASVPEALAAIEKEPPTVLVSDIGMPNQDGYDLIRAVRKLPPERGGQVPAAALTAYARAEDRRRTIDAGFTMHLSKPVDPAELVAIVASLTRTPPPR